MERAAAAEVSVVAVAVDLESSVEVVRMLSSHESLVGGVIGVHPRHASMPFDEGLLEMARPPGILAIGECGFDGAGPPWEAQAEIFIAQCRIARELDRALVLHVDGDGAFEQLIRHANAMTGLRVVRHYLTGDDTQANWHRERGHFLSFGNPLGRQHELQVIAGKYPPDLLLIETDSYPLPGRTTEPKDVVSLGIAIAGIREWTLEATRERLAENTAKAFGLARM